MTTEVEGIAQSVSAARTANRHVGLWLAASIIALFVAAIAACYALGMNSVPIGQEVNGAPQVVQAEQLRRSNRLLQMELNCAAAGESYLVLDLPKGSLVLKSHGAPLREFRVHETVVRASRLALPREGLGFALDTVWTRGVLLPPRKKQRVVILSDTVAPYDPSGTVSFIPPAPEEEFPTLPTFRIRFSGRLSLLVRDGSRHEPSVANRLSSWVRLRSWRLDRARVELVLSSEEAGAFYRAFTDGTKLLVSGAVGETK